MHLTQSIFRTYSALRVCVVVLVTGVSATAYAQTDRPAIPPRETDPIVISLQASDPSTLPELARAIQMTLNISRDDLARQYISRLAQTQADDGAWFALMRQYGSDALIRLAMDARVQPEGRQLAEQILVAAGRYANDPVRLVELTKQVASSNIVARTDALENLQSLGAVGVASLLNALADECRAGDRRLLRAALARCAPGNAEPIVGAIQSSNPRLQLESVWAARYLAPNEAVLPLLRPALAADSTPELRQEARNSLTQLVGSVPDVAAAAAQLTTRIDEHLSRQPPSTEQFLAPRVLWRTHPQTGQLVELKRSRPVAERIEAAERAEDLIKIQPDNPSNQRLYAIALIEAAEYLRGFEGNVASSDEMSFARNAGPEFMEQVLADAMDRGLLGAATGACDILGQIGDQRLLRGDTVRPLVRAASFGDRRVQFAACEAIMRIDPASTFPGSSAVAETILSLAESRGRPKVLVGHPHVADAQNMADAIALLGFDAQGISSGQELIREATENADVEFIVLSETLGSPTYQDLIFRLRSDPRTQRIPIALQYQTETEDVAWQTAANAEALQIYLVVDTRQFENYDDWLRRTRSLAGLRMPLLLIVKPGDTEIAFGWAASDSLVRYMEMRPSISPISKVLPEQVRAAFGLSRTPVSLVLQPDTVSPTQVEAHASLVLDPDEWVFWPQWTKHLHDNALTNQIAVVRANQSGLQRESAVAEALGEPADGDRIDIEDLDFLYSRVTELLSTKDALTISRPDAEAIVEARRFEIDDPLIVTMPWTLDRTLVARQMNRLAQLAGSMPVNSSQRSRFGSVAFDWLAKISGNPSRYPFWELTAYDQRIASIAEAHNLTPTACQTLGNLGTPFVQRELADIASRNQLPLELRQAAVAALQHAFAQHGILLTREQIQLQYDRYNASAELPEETQQILGDILNAIERPSAVSPK